MEFKFFQSLPLLLLVNVIGEIQALKMEEIVFPEVILNGQSVFMECNYDMEQDVLYSLKFYKDGNEFYRFLPSEQIQRLAFPLPGFQINLQKSTDHGVQLETVDLQASGTYRCEVEADAPSFQTEAAQRHLEVVDLPDGGPRITGVNQKYRLGDTLRANCTSLRSHPVAHHTWEVNGDQLPSNMYQRHPVVDEGNRLMTAITGLNMTLTKKDFFYGDLRLCCAASIGRVYYVSYSVEVQEDKTLTEMPEVTDTN